MDACPVHARYKKLNHAKMLVAEADNVRHIVVLGGGTAGLLAALAIERHLPQIRVTVVRSSQLGIIGVGEGTVPSIVRFLHDYLSIDSKTFHQTVRPSLKLGLRFLWGKRSHFHYSFSPQFSAPVPGLPHAKGWYCNDDLAYADICSALMDADKSCLKRIDGRPRFVGPFAYHLENERLVGFLETLTDNARIEKIDDVVVRVKQREAGIESLELESGRSVRADLFVDCSGFRSELLGRSLSERFVDFSNTLLCDRAVAGGWPRTHEIYKPYTTAETMRAGWCWQIEHDELINRGYVYSSRFIDDAEAEKEFREKCPRLTETRTIRFRTGVHERTWVKNVVALGNAAGFVEPLEATAIGMMCDGISLLVRALQSAHGRLLDIHRDNYNRYVWDSWQTVRDFLALHYKFNDRLNSPFWQAANEETTLGRAQHLVDYFRAGGPDFRFLDRELRTDMFTSEGYLAMLLGQGVAFNAPAEPLETERWKQFKMDLQRQASAGMDMHQCLSSLRMNGLTKSDMWFNPVYATPSPGSAIV